MKISSLCFIFLFVFTPIVVNALDMDECTIGDTVYIDDWFDKKVNIVDKNFSDNTVKVKASNGETQWVKPSDLMGEFGKVVEDVAEDAAIEGMKWFVKEMMKDPAKGSDGGTFFHAENKCHEEAKLALYYLPVDEDWKKVYWYTMSPGDSYYLVNKNGKKLTSKNSIFFFYAESDDGGTWGTGTDTSIYINGDKFSLKQKVDKQGVHNIVLVCNN